MSQQHRERQQAQREAFLLSTNPQWSLSAAEVMLGEVPADAPVERNQAAGPTVAQVFSEDREDGR